MKFFEDWLGGYLEGRGVKTIEELDAKGVAAVVAKMKELNLVKGEVRLGDFKWPSDTVYKFTSII